MLSENGHSVCRLCSTSVHVLTIWTARGQLNHSSIVARTAALAKSCNDRHKVFLEQALLLLPCLRLDTMR